MCPNESTGAVFTDGRFFFCWSRLPAFVPQTIAAPNSCGEGRPTVVDPIRSPPPAILTGRADIPVLEVHIPFRDRFLSRWDGIAHTQMAEKQFDMSYTPFVQTEVNFQRPGDYHTFDVHYHKETLQTFSPYSPLLDRFLGKVEKGEAASLLGGLHFLSTDMIRVITEMLHYDFIDAVPPKWRFASATRTSRTFTMRLNDFLTSAQEMYEGKRDKTRYFWKMTPAKKHTLATLVFYMVFALLIGVLNHFSPSGPCTPGLGMLPLLFLPFIAGAFLCFSLIDHLRGRATYWGPNLINGALLLACVVLF